MNDLPQLAQRLRRAMPALDQRLSDFEHEIAGLALEVEAEVVLDETDGPDGLSQPSKPSLRHEPALMWSTFGYRSA